MSEMMRNKGTIRRISTQENIKEVYEQLVKEGKITSEFNELSENGVPEYIEDDNYEIINGCIFDMSGAPAEYDSYEDVEEVTKLNDTDYKIHLYYYNGGTNDAEILEEAIPKADLEYAPKTSKQIIREALAKAKVDELEAMVIVQEIFEEEGKKGE